MQPGDCSIAGTDIQQSKVPTLRPCMCSSTRAVCARPVPVPLQLVVWVRTALVHISQAHTALLLAKSLTRLLVCCCLHVPCCLPCPAVHVSITPLGASLRQTPWQPTSQES
jgi:hypothetical protein